MITTIMGVIVTIAFIVLVYQEIVNVQWAFILLPVAGALILGCSFNEIRDWVVAGLTGNAKTSAFSIFCVMFFAVMGNVGAFDGIISCITKKFSHSVIVIFLSCWLIATLTSLDGAAASTAIVTSATMLPVFKRAKIRPICLGFVCASVIGAFALFPWSGSNLSYCAALGTDPREVFGLTIIPMAVGYAFSLFSTLWIAVRESRRIAAGLNDNLTGWKPVPMKEAAEDPSGYAARHRKMRPINLCMIGVLLICFFTGWVDATVISMICTGLAFVVNYPHAGSQQKAFRDCAPMALTVGGLFLAAGPYTQIMNGTGMMGSMITAVLKFFPASAVGSLHIILAFISVPLVFFLGSYPFVYGVSPVVSGMVSEAAGITATQVHATLMSGMGPYLLCCIDAPAVYLLLELLGGISLKDYAKFTLPWMWAQGSVMLLSGLCCGCFV